MKKVDERIKKVPAENKAVEKMNIKTIMIIVLLIVLFVVCVMAGLNKETGDNTVNSMAVLIDNRQRDQMLSDCEQISIDGVVLTYPLTINAIKEAGFDIEEENEDSFGIVIDTESFEGAKAIKRDNKTSGWVVYNESGEVIALRGSMGHMWTIGGIKQGMTKSEMVELYGVPDKAYTGVYSGYLYNLGETRIYVNTRGAGDTSILMDFVYVTNDTKLFIPELIVKDKRILLEKDIYGLFDNLKEAGYTVEVADDTALVKYNIKDKQEKRVGNIIYNGVITGTYTISMMGEDVGIGVIKKGQTKEEIADLLAYYGEPEKLYDGTFLYKIGNVYSDRELDVIVGFDTSDKVNYIACNIIDILNNYDYLPYDVESDIEVDEPVIIEDK